MFEHVVGAEVGREEFAVGAGGLLDDTGVGNDDDDAAEAPGIVGVGERRVVVGGVAKSKSERGKSFAAAGGRG